MTAWRSTIRVRLAVLYGGMFFLAGAGLIALTYAYLGLALHRQLTVRTGTGPAQLHEALMTLFAQGRNNTMHAMLIWSWASLGAISLVAGGLGWLLANRALRPLQRITATARSVAEVNLHERIALDGPDDEIKDLADTFDAMLERLDHAFDAQRRFVANASHELRTPLTINRTLIEVALHTTDAPETTRRLGASLLQVNQRHERLIDGLLVLASSEQHLTERSRVDLADIARRVAALSHDAARHAGIEIHTTIAPASVDGDPVLLEHLTQNLIDNAIRYNITPHGWVTICTGITDGHAWLTVENTGPPVPSSELDRLFEPFHRHGATDRLADPGPSSPDRGAGLGLSIVRSVAQAHHGDVHAQSRSDGGLRVHTRIPTTP